MAINKRYCVFPLGSRISWASHLKSVGLVNPIAVGASPIPVMAVLVACVCLTWVIPAVRGRMVSAAIVRANGGRGTCSVVVRAAWSRRVGPVSRSESGRQG
jgi:hypothetical protein